MTAPLSPFFKYFGSKFNIAHLYPAPRHETIKGAKRRLTEYQADKLELQRALDGLSALHRYAALPSGVLDKLLRLTIREAREHGLSVAGTSIPFKWKAARRG